MHNVKSTVPTTSGVRVGATEQIRVLCAVTAIHIRNLSSAQTETLSPLNANSPHQPRPSAPHPLLYSPSPCT